MPKQKVKKIVNKCCANCANRIQVDDYPECKFDSEIPLDSEEMHYLVCNWFESTSKGAKTKKKTLIYVDGN